MQECAATCFNIICCQLKASLAYPHTTNISYSYVKTNWFTYQTKNIVESLSTIPQGTGEICSDEQEFHLLWNICRGADTVIHPLNSEWSSLFFPWFGHCWWLLDWLGFASYGFKEVPATYKKQRSPYCSNRWQNNTHSGRRSPSYWMTNCEAYKISVVFTLVAHEATYVTGEVRSRHMPKRWVVGPRSCSGLYMVCIKNHFCLLKPLPLFLKVGFLDRYDKCSKKYISDLSLSEKFL